MVRRKYSHQPCYILLNSHGMVIGAHFRRLAIETQFTYQMGDGVKIARRVAGEVVE
jgi:hypothetical protein